MDREELLALVEARLNNLKESAHSIHEQVDKELEIIGSLGPSEQREIMRRRQANLERYIANERS